VFVIDTDIEHTRMGGWWLSDENMRDVAASSVWMQFPIWVR